jgi:putative transcriptional regulator
MVTGSRTTSLARHLLCAVPQLQDPNFKRSVVLMLDHTRDGALGLVVNHVLPNTVAEVTDGLGLSWGGDAQERVRLGGPCEPMRGWILHDQPAWDQHAQRVLEGIWLTTSLDPIDKEAAVGGVGQHYLFVLGYAGWGESQLEGEIAAGSWVAVPVLEDEDEDAQGLGVPAPWLFATDPDRMWDEALRSIGVDPGRLVGLKGGTASLH